MSEKTQDIIYNTYLAKEMGKYDEMTQYMRKYALCCYILTIEERNLLLTSYNLAINTRRTSLKKLSGLEDTPEAKKFVHLHKEYRHKLRREVDDFVKEIIDLLDSVLITSAPDVESMVFYAKMKGDYYRYQVDFQSSSDARKETRNLALSAYKEATKLSHQLEACHVTCIGLALNFSVFYYKTLDDVYSAKRIGKKSLNQARYCDEYKALAPTEKLEVDKILNLLSQNLKIWQKKISHSEQPLGAAMG